MTAHDAGHGVATLPARHRTLAFVALLIGALATMLNTSVVNVALPDIAASLKPDGATIDLIADGDSIALSAMVLLFGAMGDAFGRRRMFLAGCSLLAVFSLLCARATTAEQLVLFRLGVGASSAMLFPATLSMTTGLYADPVERAGKVAIWTGVAAVGAAVGPILAGWLLEWSSWPSIFLLSVPMALLAVGLAWAFLPEQRDEEAPPLDWQGGLLAAVGLAGSLVAIILTPLEGLNRETLVPMGLGVLGLVGFVWRERTAAHPLIDLSVFRVRRFTGGTLVLLALFAALAGVMFLAAQFSQNVLGYSPLQSGLAILPVTLGVILVTPFNVPLEERVGPRLVASAGVLLVGLGLLSMLQWHTDSTYWHLGLTFGLLGVGLGLAMAPCTNSLLQSLPREKAGVASAVNDLIRDFGSALGVAVMGSLASLTYAKLLGSAFAKLSPDQQASVPENVVRLARSSLSGAQSIANAYPGADADALMAVAREAFLAGQTRASLIGAAVAAVALLIAWTCLPKTGE